jgi:hypothetical protein
MTIQIVSDDISGINTGAIILSRHLTIMKNVKLLLTCAFARKRIANRIAHHRKFALFPGYPNSLA